ncbi:hypothetical protein CF204P1_19270 [Citrobacter freundii]|nr:hypothetical protein CF204P1_19270 [Citrobacter freundii]
MAILLRLQNRYKPSYFHVKFVVFEYYDMLNVHVRSEEALAMKTFDSGCFESGCFE